MFYHEFTNKNKEIQNKLLLFLDKEDDIEENYNNLIDLLTSYKILANHHELKSLLYLISNISNNHYHSMCFIDKIERLLQYLKEDIKKNFTNLKIFDIFKSNKLILLNLIEQEIMTFDQSILNRICSEKYFKRSYHHFFFPEIYPLIENGQINVQSIKANSNEQNKKEKFIDDYDYEKEDTDSSEKNTEEGENHSSDLDSDYVDNICFYKSENFRNLVDKFSKKLPDNFLKQRKIGQNENYICKLIREDLIDEFISYVNQYNYPLNSNIEKSIYETNSLLIKSNPTLIEYAAFFGSIQTFKYLYLNKVKLTPSLWIYGIHGDNPELINILEENHIQPKDYTFFECIKEAIKCHHIDIANYIQDNYLNEKVESNIFIENILLYSFHYYNYSFFPKELNNRFDLYYACKYDYYTIVEDLIKTKEIDLVKKVIYIYII